MNLTLFDNLLSFDIVIPNVPVPDTLQIVDNRFDNHDTSTNRTNLLIDVIEPVIFMHFKCNCFELEVKS